MRAQSLIHVRLLALASPWTVAHQAPLSMECSRQEYWSTLPFPPPGDLLNPGIQPTAPTPPALQVDSLLLNHQGSPKLLGAVTKAMKLSTVPLGTMSTDTITSLHL